MELLTKQNYETKVYFVTEENPLPSLSEEFKTFLTDQEDFKGKFKETYLYMGPFHSNFMVMGLGKLSDLTYQHMVAAAFKAAKSLNHHKVVEASIILPDQAGLDKDQLIRGISEGFYQSSYRYEAYRQEKKDMILNRVSIESDSANLEALLMEVKQLLDGVFITRDFGNTPANDLTPSRFADKVVELFSEIEEVQVEVFNKEEIEKLGMKALLSVSQGSVQEPRFVVMKYMPMGPDQDFIALVGKGVTYDSGGYALKQAQGMASMKSDMGGAGSVVGAMYAIAKNKLPHNVYGVFAATENLIGGNAFKNGDVIHSMKGSTIEVGNTDAEGRLVLADAVYYTANVLKPSHIIDLATLTGAAVYTFGEKITPIVTNNQAFADQVLAASEETGEMMWQMPMTEDIRDRIKGDISDLSNMPKKGKGGGIQVAAAFIEYFAEDLPWVHMDIAGTSYLSGEDEFLPKYATGVPVKTLHQIIKNH